MDFVQKQDICREFCQNEVNYNITEFANYLFGLEGGDREVYATYDEFDNGCYRVCPNCGEIVESEDEFESKWLNTDGDADKYICPDCGEEYDSIYDLDEEYNEPMEYYIVSPYLGRRLREHGEMILERSYRGWIWGRCGFGQAIYLDGVIEKICEEVGLFKEKEAE